MTLGPLTKTFLILLCLDLFLFVYMPTDWHLDNGRIFETFFDVDRDAETMTINSTQMNETVPASLQEDSTLIGGSAFSLVATFRMIWDFLKLLGTFLFAPVVIISNIGAPFIVNLIFSIIFVPLMIFGFMQAIRGGEI
jgi:hypothetical protein